MGSFFNRVATFARYVRVSFFRVSSRGYTILELMVVGAIIGILAVVILTSHVSFSRSTALSSAAYDVALSLRNAQVFGIGSRGAGTVRNAGYGMEFTLGSTFRMFADTYEPVSAANPTPNLRPGNGHYDAPNPPTVPGDVPSQQYALNNGVTVSKFCGITTASAQYCTDSSGANQITKLDVVFSRPNTLASTSVYTTASTWLWEGFNRSCITLSTPQGATRHITVSRIGQISIAPSCP